MKRIALRYMAFSFMALLYCVAGICSSGQFIYHPIDTNCTYAFYVDTGDIDGDGDDDIAVARYGPALPSRWYEKVSTFQYAPHDLPVDLNYVNPIICADIDRDGNIDIVCGESDASGRIVAFLNSGSGDSFSTSVLASAGGVFYLRAADIDGTNGPDIAVAHQNGVMWLQNDGSGTFVSHNVDNAISGPRSVQVVDFDHDGNLDIISPDYGGGTVYRYMNDGSNNFARYAIASYGRTSRASAGDIDNDGDVDLAGVNYNMPSPVLFVNSNATFTSQAIGAWTGHASIPRIIDVDGDGLQDIVVNQGEGTAQSWYQQTATWSFCVHILTNTIASGELAPKDADDDSDIDLIGTDRSANTLAIWEQVGNPATMPMVNITENDATVSYSESWREVWGTNVDVAGKMWWTNSLTGANGRFTATSPWCIPRVDLGVAVNSITVYGTNTAGLTGSDTLTITRQPASLGFVDIINGDAIEVPEGTTSTTINGTNVNIVGSMRWTNELSATGNVFGASAGWSQDVPLAVGHNIITVKGTNVAGIVAQDTIDILRPEPPSTYIVKVTTPDSSILADVGSYLTIVTKCNLSCPAQIGWGTSTNGAGWAWTTNLPVQTDGSEFFATTQITPALGTNYIGARWIHSYITNYGWRLDGNTNDLDINSALTICVTAGPSQIVEEPWDFGGQSLTGVIMGGGITVATVENGVLIVDGVSHSRIKDTNSCVTFRINTSGKKHVTFHVKVRRNATGPRKVELDYLDKDSVWQTYPMVYTLEQTGVWYTIGGRIPLDGADGLEAAEFRIVAYNATASELDLQSPSVTSPIPEPTVVGLLAFLGVLIVKRRQPDLDGNLR